MLQLYRNGAEIKSFYTWRQFSALEVTVISNFFFSWCVSMTFGCALAHHEQLCWLCWQSLREWTHTGCPKAIQDSPGYLCYRQHRLDQPQHWCCPQPLPWELCIKGGRQHCHRERGAIWPLVGAPGERWCLVWERETGQCLYEVTYFFLFTCKQGLFPRSNEDRAEADFTLDRCYMSLCSSVYFLWANQMVNTFYIAKKDELL